jgi:hypothetical protein
LENATSLYNVLLTLQKDKKNDNVGWIRSEAGYTGADIVIHLLKTQYAADKMPVQPDDKLHLYVADGSALPTTGNSMFTRVQTWSWLVNVPNMWETVGVRLSSAAIQNTVGAIKEAAVQLSMNKIRSHNALRTITQIKTTMEQDGVTIMDVLWGRNYGLVAETDGVFYGTTNNSKLLKDRLGDLRGEVPSLADVAKRILDLHGET